jgi:hypothetical protein
MTYLIWPALVLAAWGIAWHFWFAPLLTKIKLTMGVTDATLGQRFEGSKTILASFFLSMFAIIKSLLDILSSDTTILDEVKTNFPWTTYVSPDTALKIVAFFPILIVFLHLYGKLKAALTTPVE